MKLLYSLGYKLVASINSMRRDKRQMFLNYLIHFSLLLVTTNVYAQKKKSTPKLAKKTSVEAKSYHDLSIMWEANQVSEKEKRIGKGLFYAYKNLKLDAKSSSQGVFRKVKCLGIVNKVDFKKVQPTGP